jgi:hypothetical protein
LHRATLQKIAVGVHIGTTKRHFYIHSLKTSLCL